MPRYLLSVRHFDNDYWVDEPEGVQLSDDAAAREFALRVMRGLLIKEKNWKGWTMEVMQGGRRVWRLPFDAMTLSGDC